MGLREEILGARPAADIPVVPVPTPEWPSVDGKLFVRMLSAYEADIPLDEREDAGAENYRARFACRVACDEERRRVLRDEDAIVLGQKEVAVVDRICQIAWELNGMTSAARDRMRKNSLGGEGDGSPSSSPEP